MIKRKVIAHIDKKFNLVPCYVSAEQRYFASLLKDARYIDVLPDSKLEDTFLFGGGAYNRFRMLRSE